MRVLHLVNDVTDRGNGIVNAAVDLAMEQARQGFDVAMVSAGGGYQPLLREGGVQHLTLDRPRNPRQFLRALQSLRRHLRSFQPDVVHAHMRTGLLLAWVLKHFHRFPLVGHVHNVHDRETILMGLADRVIAVSESVAKSMECQHIPRRKIRVVLNRTLGTRRVPPLSAVGAAGLQRPAIVTVCGMSSRKGIKELLRSFEWIGLELQDAHLYLVGDGPDRLEFERQARLSMFSDRIHFEGYQCLPQAYMLSADVFVLASRRESFGLVLIEAREAGCAIVATDTDGIAEALDGGRAGTLVPPNDLPALADAICHLLTDDAERKQWQHNAKEGVSRFYIDQMAVEMLSVYDELLASRAARPLEVRQRYSTGDSSE
jgi:glycosyltransferase involved in cell wall biosynthesis